MAGRWETSCDITDPHSKLVIRARNTLGELFFNSKDYWEFIACREIEVDKKKWLLIDHIVHPLKASGSAGIHGVRNIALPVHSATDGAMLVITELDHYVREPIYDERKAASDVKNQMMSGQVTFLLS